MTIDKAELKERLSAEITEIAKSFEYSPDKLSEFLSFGSRFRGYSYKNVQLIYAQRPTASFVAPASRYFAGLPSADGVPLSKDPLYIKKGERAIYIFAPCEVTYYSCGGEQRTWSKLTAGDKKDYKANPQKWSVSKATYFKLVPVFDLVQVNCPKELLPAVLGVGTDSLTAAAKFESLRRYVEEKLHIPVAVEDFGSLSLRGTYNISANAIRINSALGDTQRLSTLIHELAHSQLHSAPTTTKSTAQKELEADMYAIMLEKYCGIDTTDARKQHLADNYKEYILSLPPSADKTATVDALFDNVFKRWQGDMPDISACLAAEHNTLQDLAARQSAKHR